MIHRLRYRTPLCLSIIALLGFILHLSFSTSSWWMSLLNVPFPLLVELVSQLVSQLNCSSFEVRRETNNQ